MPANGALEAPGDLISVRPAGDSVALHAVNHEQLRAVSFRQRHAVPERLVGFGREVDRAEDAPEAYALVD